jgi:hypothetical protein
VRFLVASVLAVLFSVFMAPCAHADGITSLGDEFSILFTQNSPTSGTGSATITLGPQTSAGAFDISSLSITSIDGVCPNCALLAENLSGLLFDSADFDLAGTITGAFTAQTGSLNQFRLLFTDGGATWVFTDKNITANNTTSTSGTYSTAPINTPESSTLMMLGIGLITVGVLARRALSPRP